MQDDERELTQQESLLIIQQMINTAKHEQKDDGKSWIIWGWMLFLSSIVTVLNLWYSWGLNRFFFWNILGIVTLVFLVADVIKRFIIKKPHRVQTYTKSLFDKLNTGFFICIIFNILAINIGVGPTKGFALLIGLYGFWVLIYGTALDFRPSVIASFVTWAFGFAALFQTRFDVVMLLHAGAVFSGYIIPGHIANKEFKKLKGRNLNRSSSV